MPHVGERAPRRSHPRYRDDPYAGRRVRKPQYVRLAWDYDVIEYVPADCPFPGLWDQVRMVNPAPGYPNVANPPEYMADVGFSLRPRVQPTQRLSTSTDPAVACRHAYRLSDRRALISPRAQGRCDGTDVELYRRYYHNHDRIKC